MDAPVLQPLFDESFAEVADLRMLTAANLRQLDADLPQRGRFVPEGQQGEEVDEAFFDCERQQTRQPGIANACVRALQRINLWNKNRQT